MRDRGLKVVWAAKGYFSTNLGISSQQKMESASPLLLENGHLMCQ